MRKCSHPRQRDVNTGDSRAGPEFGLNEVTELITGCSRIHDHGIEEPGDGPHRPPVPPAPVGLDIFRVSNGYQIVKHADKTSTEGASDFAYGVVERQVMMRNYHENRLLTMWLESPP